MKVSVALAYWTIAIFVWIYLLPILIVGFICCVPFFIVVTPPLFAISISVMYLLKDEIIPNGYIRDIVNNIPYKLWFGAIDELPPLPTPRLICSHPHGILCTGILISAHFRPGSTTVFAVSKWLFAVPFVGWLARHLGCIPATYEDIERALQSHSVILVPGGVPELITGRPYTRRTGFLKIARSTNVPILPVETKSTFFDMIPCGFQEFRMWVAKCIGIPLMLPVIGWYGTWLPKRVPIHLRVFDEFIPSGDIKNDNAAYYNIFTT